MIRSGAESDTPQPTYENPLWGVIPIQRLMPGDITPYLAAGALHLVADTYRSRFEDTTQQLDQGTVFAHFQPNDPKHITDFATRMQRAMSYGDSEYWIVRSAIPDRRRLALAGLIKVSPSSDKLVAAGTDSSRSTYLNDILVSPSQQEHGIGSALLHAALSRGSCNPNGKLVLDAYNGNELTNMWFEKLGLHRSRGVGRLRFLNGQSLPRNRYSSREQSVQGVVMTLETQKTWLRQFEPVANPAISS